jgi:hypothetical protein
MDLKQIICCVLRNQGVIIGTSELVPAVSCLANLTQSDTLRGYSHFNN